jgi:dCMP deaminase
MDKIQKENSMMPPRDVLSWDYYFLNLCKEVATRSKDPSTQHGSVIVDKDNRIVSTGYNGGSRKIDDKDIDWSRDTKYSYIIHAEENGLWSAEKRNLEGCSLYVTGPPCSKCMLRISHSGISRVIYGDKKSNCVDENDWKISLDIANKSKIKLENIKC